jgi:hypothetical protein
MPAPTCAMHAAHMVTLFAFVGAFAGLVLVVGLAVCMVES